MFASLLGELCSLSVESCWGLEGLDSGVLDSSFGSSPPCSLVQDRGPKIGLSKPYLSDLERSSYPKGGGLNVNGSSFSENFTLGVVFWPSEGIAVFLENMFLNSPDLHLRLRVEMTEEFFGDRDFITIYILNYK